MSVEEVVAEICTAGIQLWSDGPNLRYAGLARSLPEGVLRKLAAYKREIRDFLADRKFVQPSFGQERLYYLHALDPDSRAYNIALGVRLTGTLDVDLLRASFQQVAYEQEILRTTFHLVGGVPLQVIQRTRRQEFEFFDLSAELNQKQTISNHKAKACGHRFDLEQGPLWKAVVLRQAQQEHLLLLVMHHAITDGWSMGVLFNEVIKVYGRSSQSQPLRFHTPRLQYSHFALWQRQRVRAELQTSQLAYWKEKLGKDFQTVQLPRDPAGGESGLQETGSQVWQCSDAQALQIEELSQKLGTTPFVLLLALLKVLVGLHTNQWDLGLGIAVSGRTNHATEDLIGFFINTLVVRTNLEDNPAFAEAVARVQEAFVSAYANQDVPFEEVVHALRPLRRAGESPLFNILVNYLDFPVEPESPEGLKAEPVPIGDAVAKYSLTVYIDRLAHTFGFRFVYRTADYSHEKVQLWQRHLAFLLEQILQNANQRLRQYSLVDQQSQAQLPNPAESLSAPELPKITDLVLAWIRKAPENIALTWRAQSISYGELHARAERIREQLSRLGVRKGEVVAIQGRGSPGFFAALLGTMLGGHVVMTLDAMLPQERRAYMLSEAAASGIILVADQLAGERGMDWELGKGFRLLVDVCTAEIGAAVAPEPSFTPCPVEDPDAAYLFFTSGTTGRPKAVLGSHRGLSHFVLWQRDTFNVRPIDAVAQITGLSFDVILREVFLPWSSGARLCIPETIRMASPETVFTWLRQQQVTIMHLVPSLAQYWLNEPGSSALPALRCVFFAGEPLTQALVERWRSAFSHSHEIVNLYGPTETTLAKCFYRVPQLPQAGIQPIGRPLPNTQVLIMKLDQALCGLGEIGEIVIRTPFRSHGYFRRPEETGQKFVRNRHAASDDDQLYFTGDLGRYRLDGELEILGRTDRQIKIRGMRVEPGEIEAAITALDPAISQAVVILDERGGQPPKLVAYVVPRHGLGVAPAAMRAELKRTLPDFMIPASIVSLPQLPMTVNGKLDREALPPPPETQEPAPSPSLLPRSRVEKEIAHVWAEALKLPSVGLHDNYFDIGGHSLLMMEVFRKLRERLPTPVQFSIIHLFQYPTVALLARFLEGNGDGQVTEARVRAEKRREARSRKRQALLSRAQASL